MDNLFFLIKINTFWLNIGVNNTYKVINMNVNNFYKKIIMVIILFT